MNIHKFAISLIFSLSIVGFSLPLEASSHLSLNKQFNQTRLKTELTQIKLEEQIWQLVLNSGGRTQILEKLLDNNIMPHEQIAKAPVCWPYNHPKCKVEPPSA